MFLVVDGWSTLRADFDDLEVELQQLATRGLTFGLHVVVGAARWADFRAAMRDLFGTRLELRLGDPMDSEIDRKVAALVPAGRPGRGLVQGKLHFLAALPRIDGSADVESLGDGRRGPGQAGRRRLDRAGRAEAAAAAGADRPRRRTRAGASRRRTTGGCCSALNELDLGPVALDVDAEPHLLVFGDGQSGKSGVLRAYAHEIMRTRSPKEAQLVVVDYRRSLLGEVPEEYLLNYLTSAPQAQPALRELATYLESRIPGPDVTPEQLRNRSWWTGAEVFVLVDDYDLVATQQSSPLQALQPLLAQARDVGLHLVRGPPLRRRVAGALRAGHPVAARPGDARPAALRQPRRGSAARQPEAAAGRRPAAAGWSPATAASRSCRWPGSRRRCEADRAAA